MCLLLYVLVLSVTMSKKLVLSVASIVSYFEATRLISKGENSYCSGHVQKPVFDASLGIIAAEVLASMRNKSYKVELNINDGSIVKSTCQCPRGLDQCHHMCAVAFFIHYNISSTDKTCSWTALKAKSDIGSTAEEQFPLKRDYVNPSLPLTEDENNARISRFYENLKQCGPTGFS
ncbi:hypothetical protein RN001_001827 [Aquatica leii]|uniref:SWIM-type domain-containing protein n=1 Tax=Aquatica leii TaxID=1421715 RepID=A0AAN7SCX7_9COLE|nr:hypothetical protein RN001_001827 [Aquatica leii]